MAIISGNPDERLIDWVHYIGNIVGAPHRNGGGGGANFGGGGGGGGNFVSPRPRPRAAAPSPTPARGAAPGYSAPAPVYRQPAPAAPAFTLPADALGNFVRSHYADNIQADVYRKLLTRGFAPPPATRRRRIPLGPYDAPPDHLAPGVQIGNY